MMWRRWFQVVFWVSNEKPHNDGKGGGGADRVMFKMMMKSGEKKVIYDVPWQVQDYNHSCPVDLLIENPWKNNGLYVKNH